MMKKLYNNKYTKLEKIGGGSFGCVYLVEDESTHKKFAMKKFYLDNLKEAGVQNQFELLKSLSNENIIEVIETFFANGNHYMISNFYSNTLYDFTKKHLSEKTIKGIIKQIITAVGFLHSKKYIHRDIKPDNILLDSKGTIKLTDFDLARLLPESNDKPLTRNVVTLYYRAPEIFFGDVHYGKGVDIWSIGCVFGEFFIDEPIFKGACELATLSKIIEMCGNPNEENWPGVEKLPNYLPYGEIKPKLRNEFEGKISKEGVDVLEMMLSLDPKKRPSCEELLNMSYFKENVASKEEIATELNLK